LERATSPYILKIPVSPPKFVVPVCIEKLRGKRLGKGLLQTSETVSSFGGVVCPPPLDSTHDRFWEEGHCNGRNGGAASERPCAYIAVYAILSRHSLEAVIQLPQKGLTTLCVSCAKMHCTTDLIVPCARTKMRPTNRLLLVAVMLTKSP
jgi:hypothetical protein